MSCRAAALALCALACTATGCGDKTVAATQVMVQLDAQPGVRSQTRDVLVHVRSAKDENTKWEDRFDNKLTPDNGRYRWPLQFALLPKADDATRVYEVTATALDDAGKELARVRAISGYKPHKTLLLSLRFDDACIGKVADCEETESCRAGQCVDAQVAYTGEAVAGSAITGQPSTSGPYTVTFTPESTYLSDSVADGPPPSGMIGVYGDAQLTQTITFSKPVRDPLIAVISLGNASTPCTWTFDAKPAVLSKGPGLLDQNGSLSASGRALTGVEGNGVVQFSGTFTALSFMVTSSVASQDFAAFTVGIR
jgi:hypothetical protein